MPRKRSEAGPPIETNTATTTDAGTRVPPVDHQAPITQLEVGVLTLELKRRGYDFTLAEIEKWPEMKRMTAELALRDPTGPAPPWMTEKYVGKGKVAGASSDAPLARAAAVAAAAKYTAETETPPAYLSQSPATYTPAPAAAETPTSTASVAPASEPSRPPAEEVMRAVDRAVDPLFAKVTRNGVEPQLEQVIEAVYRVDIATTYQEIERSLVIGDEGRNDFRTLQKACDLGEEHARNAHRLYLKAKLSLESFEAEADVTMAAMRDEASNDLENEKAKGLRKKAITNADIDSLAAQKHPDEWRAQAERRAKLKGTVQHLEHLAALCKQRCYTLSTMLSTLRK